MKKLLLFLFLFAIVAVANPTHAQSETDNLQFSEELKNEVFQHIINITDMGVHSTGTIEEKQVAHYILNEFKKNNLETSIETFVFESYDISEIQLKINHKKTRVLQLCFNPYTTTKFGFDEDFILLESDNTTASDISNKIVVATSPLENSSYFRLFFNKPKLIIVISPEDFRKAAGKKARNLQCRITGEIRKYESQNVIGFIKSTHQTEDEIIISAHYDSYPGSVGADDNASGAGALIELSKYYMQHRENLSMNLRFVAFGGEEKGLLGSRAYLDNHKEHISNCKLLVNMDQIGGKDIFIETSDGVKGIPDNAGETQFPEYIRNRSLEGIESNWRILAPETIPVFSISNRPSWLAKMIEESVNELSIPADLVGNTGSDQMTFAQAGIVCTAVGTSGNKYHSPLDLPSQINKQSLEDCSKIVARVVLKTMKRNDDRYTPPIQNRQNSSSYDHERNELMAHLRFLASDELEGRKSGTKETRIAARYIVEQFRASGLKSFSGAHDYLQPVWFEKINEDKKNDQRTLIPVLCNNVVGYVEGSDSILKDEYVLLMAHYDHLGIRKDNLKINSDSVYNGARDNSMGITALIYAAKTLSTSRCKRSIVFLATTGEEEGMMGSDFFVSHSTIPLEDIIFVLNNDGGGFNDTTAIRIGDNNRINYPLDLWTEIEKMGIKSIPYPEELEYLYDFGDHISFANKGIPAITISPGFEEIDNEILKYIHQPCDEADDDFNYSYLLKFSQAYTIIAQFIANSSFIPTWKE